MRAPRELMIALAFLGMGCLFCAGLGALIFVVGGTRLTELLEALPTVPPTPELVKGSEYWLGGIELGLVRDYWINLSSLPGHGSGSTIVGVVSDSSRVTLVKEQDAWCYVEVVDEYFRDSTLTNDEIEEGWIRCSCLLGYQPMPLPTPILTPQRPSD